MSKVVIDPPGSFSAPTLVVLAAGMGSRYGGLKQLDPMGPCGETILDYSVFDALRAGFGRIVFVIRRTLAEAFQSQVLARYENQVDVSCVFQDLDDLPAGYQRPAQRTRPWGTLHAVLAARHVVDDFFAVINADDFYGRDAYQCMVAHYQRWAADGRRADEGAMLAYNIHQTLSPSGGVNRGICQAQADLLTSVAEMTDIQLAVDGSCWGRNLLGDQQLISPQARVSMNFWGLTPSLLSLMAYQFTRFLAQHPNELTAECYLPSVIDELISAQKMVCRILPTDSVWFGVTYPQDRLACVDQLRQLTVRGDYPSGLWSGITST
ncbi:sugar phosphate nucleotidyltransferase [Rhodoferax sp. BLA1]|uniref:nucleotidyltransferase family protein n=1 Tax=Rhodoferax sp. BLA1 TaxID=2576062 RepID=UPI001C554FE9